MPRLDRVQSLIQKLIRIFHNTHAYSDVGQISRACLITSPTKLEINSSRYKVHKRHFSNWTLITLSSFLGSISMSTFPFKPFFYREYIFWCNDFLSFFLSESQVPSSFFCPFKKDYMQNFVWKDNNQNFKFYSISPLGRNRIKHLSSTLKSHHRWAEIELMYGKHN